MMDEERGLLIDREQVRHIGYLIRLALTEDEVAMFSEQLSGIVDYFDLLSEVDVSDVAAYHQPPMGRDQLREDVVQPTLEREDLLANAPQRLGGFVRVPVVLDVPDGEGG